MLVLLYHFSKRSKGIYRTMFTLQFYSIHILSSNVYSCKPVYLRSYSFSTLVDLMIKHSEKRRDVVYWMQLKRAPPLMGVIKDGGINKQTVSHVYSYSFIESG